MEFASKNFTIGQLNSVVKKLGGEEATRRFLQGKLKVVEAEEIKNTPLESLNTVVVSATKKKFAVKKKFIVDISNKAKVKISYLGSNFREWFLDKVEEPIEETELRYSRLKERSVDEPIIAELGGEAKAETSLTEIFSLIEMQKNGEGGALLNDGYANIFYARDINGVLRAVGVCWFGGGWYVGALLVEDPGRWIVGYRVFSRNS